MTNATNALKTNKMSSSFFEGYTRRNDKSTLSGRNLIESSRMKENHIIKFDMALLNLVRLVRWILANTVQIRKSSKPLFVPTVIPEKKACRQISNIRTLRT
jgi:hypothetical protein